MNQDEENHAAKLLGRWCAYEVNGQAFSDGVLTQIFTDDGEIITVIRDASAL
jgi:hypothetical protein